MDITTVWSVHFSGTGTTKRVVTAVADELAAGLGAGRADFSFNLPAAREKTLTLGPRDLLVAGVPVYAGRVPNLLLPWLQNCLRGENTPAVPVVLFGNRDFDDGLMELRDTLVGNGFCPLAAGAFVGQHAFSDTLAAGRPDGEDMALALELARRTAQRVRQLSALPDTPVPVEGHTPIRPYYVPRDRQGAPITDFIRAKPVTDPQTCTGCGRCAALCPMGAIDPADPALTPGKCIKCNACVKACPTGAKGFDHKGYLYHKQELEALYGGRRADSRIFY